MTGFSGCSARVASDQTVAVLASAMNSRRLMASPPPRATSGMERISHFGSRNVCHLFDHLVGAGEHRPGNGKTERLGALQVDDKLEFGRLLDRNVGRLRPAARSYHSRDGVLPRRRGDRITTFF